MEAGTTTNLLNTKLILTFGKGAILLILIFYAIFSLIIIKQVDLMTKTFISPISPYLKALAIIHSGVILALIILCWGIL